MDKASNLKIDELELEKINILKKIYSNLDPWQKVQVSRHNDRPHTIDYVNNIFDDIIFLHGDKKYADDHAIVGGFAKLNNKSIVFMGTEKGNSMDTRIKHNFGMATRRIQKSTKIITSCRKISATSCNIY